jgi:hypothetical protein
MTRALAKPTGTPTVKELAAQVEALTAKVDTIAGQNAKQDPAAEGREPQYGTVEEWVRDYLLPTFSRPTGELGASGRWRWCEQWWRHDEAVTILTALWYGWEHAAIQVTGMLDWLPRLYYLLPILCGDDGPFRLCAPAAGDLPARHDMPPIADFTPAPAGWWNWWSESPAAAASA